MKNRLLLSTIPGGCQLQLRSTCSLSFSPSILFSNPPTTFRSLLQIHALLFTSGHCFHPFVSSKLISLYGSFGRPDLSSQAFFSLCHASPDTFLWNSLIKAYFENGCPEECLLLYRRMHRTGTVSNHFTVPMVVSSCAQIGDVMFGTSVHGASVKLGLFCGYSGAGVSSAFVYLYSRCCRMTEARKAFEETLNRDVVSWTAIISGLVSNGDSQSGLSYFSKMHCDGEAKPNSRTIELVVQACGSLGAIVAGKCLHGYSIKTGIWRHYTVRSELLSLYCRHGILREADTMFHELSEKDIVSWTAIGWSYARRGLVQETLTLFKSMLQSCIEPDTVFFDSVLTAFSSCGCVHGGKALHAAIIRRDFELDSGVLASLLKMYSNLGQLNVAEAIFAMVGENDEEPWNVMVTSYGRMQLSTYCLGLFRKMQNTAYLVPDEDCLLAVISSCSQGGNFNLAKSVHCFVMKRKAYYSASVLISLVSMYGKLGMLKAAQHIFERTNRDVSAWNNIISAYAKMEQYHEALALFDTMLLENVKPDVVTLKVALSACSSIAALPHGEGIHNYIKANDLINDVDLQTGLVDMYAKCGQLALARELFDSMHEKDTVSWTVMIWGYGTHGYAREALQLFREMEVTGAKPSDVTFLAVLTTCSHSGLVEEGRRIFHKMKDIYLLTPSCRHYTCMVDLLGRSGYLDEAENMILGMPISPDAAVWGALLGTCKMHNNAEIGERAAKRALELDPKNDGYYILLANIYETVGRRCEADTIREMMKNRGIAKAVGWSAA